MGRVAGGVPAGLLSMMHLDLRYATFLDNEKIGFCSGAIAPSCISPILTTLSVDDFGGNIVWSVVNTTGWNAFLNENDADDANDAAAAAEPPEFQSAAPLEAALIQPGCSSITNLSSTNSFAGSRLLNSILTLPRALEKFEY